jgi:hypothetical protein
MDSLTVQIPYLEAMTELREAYTDVELDGWIEYIHSGVMARCRTQGIISRERVSDDVLERFDRDRGEM